jgi:hypothetical protein
MPDHHGATPWLHGLHDIECQLKFDYHQGILMQKHKGVSMWGEGCEKAKAFPQK